MEIEDLRALMTVVSFAAFVAIVAWAYGRGVAGRFTEAERLPFDDEPAADTATSDRHIRGLGAEFDR